ncbi:MAG TPA: S8/S53 family peptidase [Actinomycetota bacterium]|nr:S8/S53 family peptidase [Actinomycetota bacterium]
MRARAWGHRTVVAGVSVVLFGAALVPSGEAAAKGGPGEGEPAPVVVATFDTGTNPFHPCFRRDWSGVKTPRDVVRNYPTSASPLPLKLLDGYTPSRKASERALKSIKGERLYYVPGTNLSFYGVGPQAHEQLVDDYPHGSQASSQIACKEFGLAPNVHLVILNWYHEQTSTAALVRWVAKQDWIDVVHFNIQDLPHPVVGGSPEQMTLPISKDKMVVIAAGNGVGGFGASYPMELSQWNGPPGSLIAGANDNGGWSSYSNLDPHVVMDGCGTAAAESHGYGDTEFSGTSSASPRLTGYVARILGELRADLGHVWGRGLLTIPQGAPRPKTGPIADGKLTAAELHEVVRKTADPNPHESTYDGLPCVDSTVPQPAPLPFAFYPKMGYGEVSEKTLADAVDVAAGRSPMPERPHEDAFYEQSETLRRTLWP